MATAISMPKLGMTMEEGTVVEWPLSAGDTVAKGDLLLIIESEKNEVEIEAPAGGVFRHVYVEAGETVPCGSLLAALTDTADEAFDPDAFPRCRRSARDQRRRSPRGESRAVCSAGDDSQDHSRGQTRGACSSGGGKKVWDRSAASPRNGSERAE